MKPDEIIEMARQTLSMSSQYGAQWEANTEDLEAFAKLVAAKEREACAKVCEQLEALSQGEDDPPPYRYYEAIRARGEA